VSQGQIWANSTELRYILDEFTRVPKPLKIDSIVEHRMTAREAEVARFAVEGLANREIARELGITEHTVKNYLFKIFDKLGVSNRVELVLSCLRREEAAREEDTLHLSLETPQLGAPTNTAMAARSTVALKIHRDSAN